MINNQVCRQCGRGFHPQPWSEDLNICGECCDDAGDDDTFSVMDKPIQQPAPGATTQNPGIAHQDSPSR